MPRLTLDYFSNALGKATSATILLPQSHLPGPYPVMFLLHGLSDDHSAWTRQTSIERYAEGKPWIIVMPDGGRSFYADAVDGPDYGTAIGIELPNLVRQYFQTRPGWAVTGLSMGGYGAVRSALAYPENFQSAVSHSGALAWGSHAGEGDPAWIQECRRIYGENPEGGPTDLLALARKAKAAGTLPHLRIDCGVDDFLIESNRYYRQFLVEEGIAHEYEEFPGQHDWQYWDLHVQEALEFHAKHLLS